MWVSKRGHDCELMTSVEIDGVTVLTSESQVVGLEHERLLRELLCGNGFVVVRGVLPQDMVTDARQKLLARGESHPGTTDKRLHNIVEDDPVFSELVVATHERVGGLLQAVMGEGHYLGSYHALTKYGPEPIEKQEEARRSGGCHSDYPGHQGTAGHLDGLEPFTVQTIWMMEDFSDANGATRVLPRSHMKRYGPGGRNSPNTREEDQAEFAAHSIPAEGRAGDLLVYIGQGAPLAPESCFLQRLAADRSLRPAVWHTAGINTTSTPRVAILGQWLPSYFSPMEHTNTITSPRALRMMPGAAKPLLGMTKRKVAKEWTEGRDLAHSLRFTADTMREALQHGLGPAEPSPSRVAPPLKLLGMAVLCAGGVASRGGVVGMLAAGVGAAAGVTLGAIAATERARL